MLQPITTQTTTSQTHLTHIDFFGGIGAFSEACRRTEKIKTIAYCDIDKSAQQVYRDNFPEPSIYSDIREYHPPKGVDLYTGGFPCTGTSNAGNKQGLNHPESALWFEFLRCINEGQPRFVVIENPASVITNGLRAILGGLRMAGYSWDNPQILQAAFFGSPQKRERLFIIAYPNDRARIRTECWSDQIGESIKRQRFQARYPSFECRGDERIIRVPPELGEVDMFQPKGIANRNDARRLFGRTIDLNCASVAIKRVLYLERVFSK
jgi:DNA (cytosine-5)-methyltransferase 1